MLSIRIIVCLSVEIHLQMLDIYFMYTSNSKNGKSIVETPFN